MFKPLLAARISSLDEIKYPVLASPKIDGIRCILQGRSAMSRTLKLIPNEHVQKYLKAMTESHGLAFYVLDGELVTYGEDGRIEDFNTIQSKIMSREGKPHFGFKVFDVPTLNCGFRDRFNALRDSFKGDTGSVDLVPHELVRDAVALGELAGYHVEQRYEGTMVRAVDGRYKHGRSTTKEGILLKIKAFDDAEFQVVGFEELETNENESYLDEVGATKRSTSKEGKKLAGTLGALICVSNGVEFSVGTGFTQEDRDRLWAERDTLRGRWAKVKYQGFGSLARPRFPVWLGFRS